MERKICKNCQDGFSTSLRLDFCTASCVETYYHRLVSSATQERDAQLSLLLCEKRKEAPIARNCAICNKSTFSSPSTRSSFVRCPEHEARWPTIQKMSVQGKKTTKQAENPYSQYFVRGPWWDYEKRAWSVLLLHSSASYKKEMEYAKYLLSVKEGKRLSEDDKVVYKDGDRSNFEVSNLALG